MKAGSQKRNVCGYFAKFLTFKIDTFGKETTFIYEHNYVF